MNRRGFLRLPGAAAAVSNIIDTRPAVAALATNPRCANYGIVVLETLLELAVAPDQSDVIR